MALVILHGDALYIESKITFNLKEHFRQTHRNVEVKSSYKTNESNWFRSKCSSVINII